MKIQIEQIDPGSEQSFQIYEYDFPASVQSFHFHDDYEAAVVDGCSGLVYCGAEMTEFISGDLFFFAGGLPHRFIDSSAPRTSEAASPRALVLQFRYGVFGESFFGLPENREISALLGDSHKGLVFRGFGSDGIRRILESQKTRRIAAFLEFFAALADCRSAGGMEKLTESASPEIKRGRDAARLSLLQEYIESEYANEASLNAAAHALSLTPTSLCRFLKRSTGRSYTELINHYRLTMASILLGRSDDSISAISAEVGIGSLSHFNSLFQKRFGCTPTEYRRRRLADHCFRV